MHAEVVKEESIQGDADSRSRHQQEKKQCDNVRRIETADSSFPKRGEVNFRFFARGFGPGPLQVNAETGDHEEEKDTDVTKRTRELDCANWIFKDVIRERFLAFVDCVIEDDAQGSSASKRIDATQAPPVGGIRLGSGHSGNFFLPQIHADKRESDPRLLV